MKEIVVSGITATGKITIGNYIGAIKNFVKLQDKYQMLIFVADLHALTNEIDAKLLQKNKKDVMALYLACGINPQKTILFFQSDLKEHAYMNWILENQTTIGEISRMTQFKDKAKTKEKNGTEKIITGLLTYPILMSADILLYNANVVPVGKDQKQHIELTRNIAQRFNNKYGKTFTIPEPYFSKEGSKIMSLVDPTKKMSKSSKQEKSFIALLDKPELAYKKIQKAVTDSENKVYVSDKKPGIKNLITIYASFKNISLKKAEEKLKNLNYGEFKNEVGIVVKNFLTTIQEEYHKYYDQVDKIAKEGAKKAKLIANKTLKKVKSKLGL